MNEQREASKHQISFRVKGEEYTKIHKQFTATTDRSLSQYIRKVLLQEPVIIHYQDASGRAIVSTLNNLSRTLSAIEGTFSQQVYKLRSLGDVQEVKLWTELTESSRQNMLIKVESIRQSLIEISIRCGHK